jgi:hypothetical protein
MMPKGFDLAISYASEDRWLARDLYDLLTPYGLSIYCFDRMPDEARGFLRERLQKIYTESGANILLWSAAYSNADRDSLPGMERRFIVHRHIHKGDAESFIAVAVDRTPLGQDLEFALVHSLQEVGVVGLEHITVQRLQALKRRPTHQGVVFHPAPTDKYRGDLQACSFRIDPGYQVDRLGRWETLADILTVFPNKEGTKFVYLIPSGLCTVFLRHTARFRIQPGYLEAKRLASIDFAKTVGNRDLSGFWFLAASPKASEVKNVTLYCSEYDTYLNDHFESCLKKVMRNRDWKG